MTELQSKLVDMMQWLHNVCEENHIRYYTIGGTTLGAVRHQGFIPWDDDLDIGVPRKEYDKLLAILRKQKTPYIVDSIEDSDDYIYPYAKLFDTRTTLIEDMRRPFKRGIFIDIFPLDGAGNTEQEKKTTYKKIRKYMMLLHAKVYKLDKGASLSKRLFYAFVKTFGFLFPSPKRLIEKITAIAKRWDFDECVYSGNIVGGWKKREIMKSAWFGKPQLVKFEHIQIYIPEHYDALLTDIFGDYMQPPPVEKRCSHHNYLSYDLNKSYLEE